MFEEFTKLLHKRIPDKFKQENNIKLLLNHRGSINAINSGLIPPTINYNSPDPECDLDYTPNEVVKKDINISMSNSFGFGGHNSVIIFKKFSS